MNLGAQSVYFQLCLQREKKAWAVQTVWLGRDAGKEKK